MAAVYVIALGAEGTDLNSVGADIYAVWDGTAFIYADGTNNAELFDLAAAFLVSDPASAGVVRVLEADLQRTRPNDAIAILETTRTTAVPTGKTVAVEPAA